jgi:hypothetical protein
MKKSLYTPHIAVFLAGFTIRGRLINRLNEGLFAYTASITGCCISWHVACKDN